AVFGGDLQVGASSEDLAALGLLGQYVSVSLSNGQALLKNLVVQHPTVHLRGRVVESTGTPGPNIMLVINHATNAPAGFQINPLTAGDGTFDAGLFGGAWNVSLECSDTGQRGLVAPSVTVNLVDGVNVSNLVLIAQVATAVITGTIQDNVANPVAADLY